MTRIDIADMAREGEIQPIETRVGLVLRGTPLRSLRSSATGIRLDRRDGVEEQAASGFNVERVVAGFGIAARRM